MNNLPTDFINKMKSLLGEEFDDFINSYDDPRTFGLRVNTLKISVDDFLNLAPFDLNKIPWASDGFYYCPDCEPGKHPYHEAGLYYIQEPSAMIPAILLSPKPGDRILDLCAAPGGKSTQIASAMKGSGLLVANEIHPARAKILSQNIERMGIKNCVVLNEDPARLETYFSEFFHKILVDAPCSGLGIIRRKPDIKWSKSPKDITALKAEQQEILEVCSRYVKPGGILVYSTCSIEPEENQGIVDSFLRKNTDFSYDDIRLYLPKSLNFDDPAGFIQLYPNIHGTDGFFVARLKRKN